jgi:hypothetical protein
LRLYLYSRSCMAKGLPANAASVTFTGNVIDALCCVLWISFRPGFRKRTHTYVFSFEDCPNVIQVAGIVQSV